MSVPAASTGTGVEALDAGRAVAPALGFGLAEGDRDGVADRSATGPYIRTVPRWTWPGTILTPVAVTRWPRVSVTRIWYGPGPAPEAISQ